MRTVSIGGADTNGPVACSASRLRPSAAAPAAAAAPVVLRKSRREGLTLFGGLYRTPASPSQLLDRFGLVDKADAPFDTLSGGQGQRLALALAFVNNPELVFLDEPTAGLDPASRRELHAEIAQMKRDGHTVLLTTHYIEEAERLCDRIAIIDRGRIVATGAPAELVAAS